MAIAFDAAATGTKNVLDTAALSFNHTCTGSNLILWVGIAFSAGDLVSTVKYNNVNMTQAVKVVDTVGNNNYLYLYYLLNPSTGTNTISITPANNSRIEACSASYTGVKQSGQPDATGSATNASATSVTASVTTIANNSWVISYSGLQRNVTASTGTTQRGSGGGTWGTAIGDSNGAITPAGSYSMSWTFSSVTTGAQSEVIASFAPVRSAGSMLLMGVGN